MSVSSSSIKKIAKDILKNNFINITVVTAIVMSVWFIIYNFAGIIQVFTHFNAFTIVLGITAFFVFLPLLMGFFRYSWRLISGVCDNPASVFFYFSERNLYFKTLKFAFSLLVRTVACFLIFYVPVFVLELITGTWLYSTLDITVPIWTLNLSSVSNILKFLAVVATLFSVMKYYLSPMLFVADENMDTAEAIYLSSIISKRTILDFIFLGVSFFGWILLSMLSIPLLFTLPYFVIGYLIHSSYAVTAFNEEISRKSHDDIPTYIAGA